MKFASNLNEETKEAIKFTVKSLNELEHGLNIGALFSGKIVCNLHKHSDVPMVFLCVDFKFNFVAISLYHTSKDTWEKLKYGDEVLIWNPSLAFVSIERDQKLYSYTTIKVTSITDILVNKVALANSYS